MLGVGFFVLCMNFRMTSEQMLQESKRRSVEGEFNVELYSGLKIEELISNYEYPISYDTYCRLTEDERYTRNLDLLFAMDFHNNIFRVEPEAGFYTHVYFMNEKLFFSLYGFARTQGMAYLGEAAYQALLEVGEVVRSDGEVNLFYLGIEIFLDDNQLWVGDKSYPYEIVMPKDKKTIMFDRIGESGYDMADALILPIEDNTIPDAISSEIHVQLRNVLFLRYRNEEWQEDLVAQLLRELNTTNKLFNFKVDNSYLELKREMDDFSYDMDRWMTLSISIMVLSGIGCAGSMFLILNERRHYMAVSIAYGSTLFRIITETFIEVFSVLLVGGMMGIIVSPMLKKVIIYTGKLKINVVGIVIVVIIAIAFSVLSVLLGMYAVKAKDVATTLKDEQ